MPVKIREQEANCDDSTTHRELENTERQNSSMSVRVCRGSSAKDFLRDADFAGVIWACTR
jgi:hypothetical protein